MIAWTFGSFEFSWRFFVLNHFIFTSLETFSRSNKKGNVGIPFILNCNVVPRDGENYAEVQSVQIRGPVAIGNFHMNSKNNHVAPIISRLIDEFSNSDWRLIHYVMRPLLAKYIGQVMFAITSPILHQVPIEDFVLDDSKK